MGEQNVTAEVMFYCKVHLQDLSVAFTLSNSHQLK